MADYDVAHRNAAPGVAGRIAEACYLGGVPEGSTAHDRAPALAGAEGIEALVRMLRDRQVVALVGATGVSLTLASNHREAPITALDRAADLTDYHLPQESIEAVTAERGRGDWRGRGPGGRGR